MKINENIQVVGPKVTLIPYLREHVVTYHKWMQDPVLLEATRSEALSLEEEFRMQQSWRNDDDKLTFLISHNESGTLMAGCLHSVNFTKAH